VTDRMKELWSAWLDGECCGKQGCTCGGAFVRRAKQDAEARNEWFLAHQIGDAIRGRPVLDDGFSVRIIRCMEGVEIDPAFDPLADEPPPA
jgi:hypothetical protein